MARVVRLMSHKSSLFRWQRGADLPYDKRRRYFFMEDIKTRMSRKYNSKQRFSKYEKVSLILLFTFGFKDLTESFVLYTRVIGLSFKKLSMLFYKLSSLLEALSNSCLHYYERGIIWLISVNLGYTVYKVRSISQSC
jgi:hypothetical protein